MPGLVYTTLRHNYIAKIPKTFSVFQVATYGSEAWTLERTALTKMNAFNSKLWEIAKNSLHRTMAGKFCKDTKSNILAS